MTALAASTQRRQKAHVQNLLAVPVNDASQIWAGALVCREAATGLAIPAADTVGIIFLGVAVDELLATADGTVTEFAATNYVRVDRQGEYEFDIPTGTPLPGLAVYAVDDNTVGLAAETTNDVFVGILTRQGSSATKWYVDIKPPREA